MHRKLNLVLLAFLVSVMLFGAAVSAEGDTGTYRINDYRVVLEPYPNGQVQINYSQTWLVTGGHIPWVTVGLANPNFEIRGFGGAAKQVKSANEGSWYGVRVDLDRDYKPGETFQFNFLILQKRLLAPKESGYTLAFTPGWYDRCFIDSMSIRVVSPTNLVNVSFEPQGRTDGKAIEFQKLNLGKGEKFPIRVNFPKEAFGNVSPENTESDDDLGFIGIILIVFFLFFLVFILAAAAADSDGDYGGAGVYAGGYSGSHDSGDSSGGGGGFGGSSFSCACACACACAGGGGAGCSKKGIHYCPACSGRGKKHAREQT
jgi:uncharacterized membrane protein YgcG